MTFHWGKQECRKKNAKTSKSVIKSSHNCGVRYWTNYKTWVSSTDVTVTDWEEGKPTLAKLKDITQAGVQAAAGGSSPIQHHPFSMSVHTPKTHGSLQPSNYLPLHPIWGAKLQGPWRWTMPWLQLSWRTGSPLLCLTALGCFLLSP